MYKMLYWSSVHVGKPFGGIRPRRLTRWLARKSYGEFAPQSNEFRWYRDRFGLEFLLHPHYAIDYEIITYGCFDEATTRFIDSHVRAGMVCLDVGANFGAVGLQMARRAGPSGVVHSFEPVGHVFDRLQQHVERNQMQATVQLHRVALSNQSGHSTMAVTDPSHPNQGMGSLVSREATLVNQITIETMTLDEFAKQKGLTRVDLVKVDIQGAEPLFLAGARGTLRTLRPDLLMEVSPTDLAQSGITSRDLLGQVGDLGYEIFKLTPKGDVGEKLRLDAIPTDFFADSVLCRHPERPSAVGAERS